MTSKEINAENIFEEACLLHDKELKEDVMLSEPSVSDVAACTPGTGNNFHLSEQLPKPISRRIAVIASFYYIPVCGRPFLSIALYSH